MNTQYMKEYKQKLSCENTGLSKPECGCQPCLDNQVRQYAPHLLEQERSDDGQGSRVSRAA